MFNRCPLTDCSISVVQIFACHDGPKKCPVQFVVFGKSCPYGSKVTESREFGYKISREFQGGTGIRRKFRQNEAVCRDKHTFGQEIAKT